MESCITACNNCIKVLPKKSTCYHSCMDCSHICFFIVKTKIYCTDNHQKLLKLCIQCCKICIEECKKHKKLKECQKCMEECGACIQDIYKNHSNLL